MTVYLMKSSTDTVTYGEELTAEVIKLENVTNIAYVESSGTYADYFAITHKTGSDADAHTTNYSAYDYILSIVPAIKAL